MKKNEFWQFVRTQQIQGGSERVSGNSEIIAVNAEGLARYAYYFWKHNGTLPDDYMPIAGKEESGDVLRRLWEIVSEDPSFQTAVLDAYEKHELDQYRDSKQAWFDFKRGCPGVWSSTTVAPQLRVIAEKAIKIASVVGYRLPDGTFVSGLFVLCLEYAELKSGVKRYGSDSIIGALFQNADLLSLISDHTQWVVKEVEYVLERFKEARELLGSQPNSTIQDDQQCFDLDVRPILLGQLIREAKSFGSWQKIFAFATDADMETKIFALYHLSARAKSLDQAVGLYLAACEVGMTSVAESAKILWKEYCSAMKPEELVKLPTEQVLDQPFLEDLILKKCED